MGLRNVELIWLTLITLECRTPPNTIIQFQSSTYDTFRGRPTAKVIHMLLNIQLPSIHTGHSHTDTQTHTHTQIQTQTVIQTRIETAIQSEQTTRAHKSTPTQKFRISQCSTYGWLGGKRRGMEEAG